jgi:hypothetical protein
MLNAVKHLYRIVVTSFNGAAEMLHCVQHDKRLYLNTNPYYRPSGCAATPSVVSFTG